jgi:MFS family permease
VLVSNIGQFMQTVGAQWLLVSLPNAALLVSLVQVADMLPDTLFGIVGGVLADTIDRRKLLIAIQAIMAATGIALTALTIAGEMPPALLLTFTLVLGVGSVIALPAYQSLVPELVPRKQIRAATALSSISINIARAVGPAIAGVLIARAGAGAVFAVNALGYVFFALVMIAWRPPPGSSHALAEPFFPALRAGGRYIRYSRITRRLLIRAGLFLVPASALWALLPVVAARLLHQGADGYGLMLGALGVGAIGGALVLPWLRDRWTINRLTFIASAVYGAALAGLVLIPSPVLAVILLLPAGAAWIAVLSEINAALQLFLPGWVRARGLAVFQMVLFGSQAVGALIWGLLAGPAGIVATFLVAAALLFASALTIRLWPFADTEGMDRSLVTPWPEHHLAIDPESTEGPVVVMTTYTIAPENEDRFLAAMTRVRGVRHRTGAVQWGLFRDGEKPAEFVELYSVPTWEEHERQHHERFTGTDWAFEQEADGLSDPPPAVRHLFGNPTDRS